MNKARRALAEQIVKNGAKPKDAYEFTKSQRKAWQHAKWVNGTLVKETSK